MIQLKKSLFVARWPRASLHTIGEEKVFKCYLQCASIKVKKRKIEM